MVWPSGTCLQEFHRENIWSLGFYAESSGMGARRILDWRSVKVRDFGWMFIQIQYKVDKNKEA
jgi:hypothetical protein